MEYRREPGAVHVAVEARETGHRPPARMRFRRQNLIPLQPHDVIDFLDSKTLSRAREFGDQQDLETVLRLAARDLRQIDHGDDLTADIGYAKNVRVCAGDHGDRRPREDFAHLAPLEPRSRA